MFKFMSHLFKSAVFSLALSSLVYADEGGAGRYVPGNAATLIDLPPTKGGWVIEPLYLHYSGDAAASKRFPNAGLVTSNLDVTSDAFILGGLYTFESPILGSHYTVGAFLPYQWMSVTAKIQALGYSIPRKEKTDGIGDITLIPAMMAWKFDSWQISTFLPIYAPTGDFKKGSFANVGKNYWTFDPTLQFSYNNQKSGFNASVFTGVMLNTKNEKTDYQSGSSFHVDASVQQLLPVGSGFLSLGFNAFYYEQFEGDSGAGAKLGSFKGKTAGIGPALGYILPIGENTLVLEARWLPELETRKRLEGDFLLFKLVYQF